MLSRSTPGPGPFGPSPAFGHPRNAIHLVPAQTVPRPGVYEGPSITTHIPWLWLAALAAALLLAAAALTHHRRRR
jgi:hypothetical protein